jgi:hypothetical protein
VGNPCPLVLIGIPPSTVTFGEDASEVQKLLAEGEQESTEGTGNPEADDEIVIARIQTKEDIGE